MVVLAVDFALYLSLQFRKFLFESLNLLCMDSKKWGIVRGNGKKVALCFWGGEKAYICRRKGIGSGGRFFALKGYGNFMKRDWNYR